MKCNPPLLLALTVFLVLSCSKEKRVNEDTSFPTNNSVSAYLPMKVGNYWVYQVYNCDQHNANCKATSIDSVFITKDTTIRRKTFFVFEGTRFGSPYRAYLRDSSNFIVNEKGQIRFADAASDQTLYSYVQLSDDQLNDTLFTVDYHMEKTIKKIKTADGNFNTVLCQGLVYLKNSNTPMNKTFGNYYAKNIGLIKEKSFLFGSGNIIYRELIHYKLN